MRTVVELPFVLLLILFCANDLVSQNNKPDISNRAEDGYRGIWYSIAGAGQAGPVGSEFAYKYSGGLGTYPANHYPFSVYVKEVDRTYFCYGGSDEDNSTLYHMVSYYDHKTGLVPKPVVVMDKKTTDAHDNPVLQVDKDGYIWIFSTSHGTSRPSYIHKSKSPHDINEFELVKATKLVDGENVPLNNFSYLQIYYSAEKGFVGLFTHYERKGGRVISWMSSPDGVAWSEWKDISILHQGQYQTSGNKGDLIGTSFNYHPSRPVRGGLDFRTNLYYVQTNDFGKTWTTVNGKNIELPLTEVENAALVHDYDSEEMNVYICDVNFDKKGRPIILYITSKGPLPGPEDGPRNWYTAHWTGKRWNIEFMTTSGNNYDMGSIYVEGRKWKVIAPTDIERPQPYNTGGEMALWLSKNKGKKWKKIRQITNDSEFNHTYARRPIHAHSDFYSFWADGHGRKPSKSRLYFSDKDGNAFLLPYRMESDFVKPTPIN